MTKPMAREGVPIFMGIVRIVFGTPFGDEERFFWWATEIDPNDMAQDDLLELAKPNGPFKTMAEAEQAAHVAIVGPDCNVRHGGMFDPAWKKLQ